MSDLVAAAAGGHGRAPRTVLVSRCLVVVVGVAVFVALFEVATLLGPAVVPGPVARGGGGPFVVRLVQPGETLWSIAAESGQGGDIRAEVDRLVRLNGGSGIRAGDTIRVPGDWAEPRR